MHRQRYFQVKHTASNISTELNNYAEAGLNVEAEQEAIQEANSERMMQDTTDMLKNIEAGIAEGRKAAARSFREAFTSTPSLDSTSPSLM